LFEQATSVTHAGTSARSAAKVFGINPTFRRYLKKVFKGSWHKVKMRYAKHQQIFTDEMEEFAQYCITVVK